MEWAAENIRKANIGVKVVYEWVDEPTADLTEVGLALSKREDIQSVIGCNVADNTQKLAFALARKKENIKLEKPLAFDPRWRVALTPSGEIVLTLLGEIKMPPEKQTFFRGFFVVLRYLPWPVVNNPKL